VSAKEKETFPLEVLDDPKPGMGRNFCDDQRPFAFIGIYLCSSVVSVNTWVLALGLGLLLGTAFPSTAGERLRIIIETDAGGDPDDEQSLVRFLLYANEWDVEGIIANRPQAREGENRNRERTGLGIVRAMIDAYGACYPRLVQHDPQFPKPEALRSRSVPGYEDTDDGVELIVRAVDAADARPVWFSNWGTDHGSASSSLKRALDRVLRERGPAGYARFKRRIYLSSSDEFGEHTGTLDPPFPLWVDTWRPEMNRKRWYHQFSAITAGAGGFDIERDVRSGHGPLGALYPTNTTHWLKEGDTLSFLYLVPNGLNNPFEPGWGGWGGRLGKNEEFSDKPYYWANEIDRWQGTINRENTLARWAEAIQNDFRARMDWCVAERPNANHPPIPGVRGALQRTVRAGQLVELDATPSVDPDGHSLRFNWLPYFEVTGYGGPAIELQNSDQARSSLEAPRLDRAGSVHLILSVTDGGEPRLTRYQRVILEIEPALDKGK